MNLVLVPPASDYLEDIALDILPQDADEVFASGGHTPMEALRFSVRQSYESFVALHRGVPICAFGISMADPLGMIGVPWLLGTGQYRECARGFLKVSRQIVSTWSQRHTLLVNYVDARHAAALKWLRWLGFERVDTELAFGVAGIPFHRMELCVNPPQSSQRSL